MNSERVLLAVAACLLALGIALGVVRGASLHGLAMVMRWLGVALLMVFAWRRRSLTPWIFVAMVAGAELGFDAPGVAVQLRVFSDIFLRLIKTIVGPLILGTLISGIAGHGDLKGVGRMAWKSLVYFEVVTTLALVIGLVAINVTKAGVGLSVPVSRTQVSEPGVVTVPAAAPAMRWQDFVLHVFPENLAKALVEGQILQVSVFAVLFGIALAMLGERGAPMLRLAESLSEVMFKFTNIVMYFAPVAVGAALAYTVGQSGAGVLVNLGKLVLTYYGALVVLAVGVMVPVMLLFRIPVFGFAKAVAEPASIAFATSASEAALPRAMEAMEAFGVPRKVVAFVLPAGYSFNMDGAAVYLTLAAIFVAQAAGMHLGVGEQVTIVLMLMLASKGVSGVPRATLMVLMATATSLRLPPEPIFVILGIDAVMDMGRTTANVVGNCLASVVVAKWEGQFGAEPVSDVVLEGMAE
ncbi:MAG TPA: cation:dicarboxylase symporter family transporter [Edaphobacter sp.]|nr:cation:dicarboxylase symporter family transporter [Edaphobacter sp.]